MPKNLAIFLLLGAVAATAQAQQPTAPNAFEPGPVRQAPSMAALAGAPVNSAGAAIGPDGRPLRRGPEGFMGGAAGGATPYANGAMPGSLEAESGPQEHRVRYVGKVNGQHLYRGETSYHFDKKPRPEVRLIEDTPGAEPMPEVPTPPPPSGAAPAPRVSQSATPRR